MRGWYKKSSAPVTGITVTEIDVMRMVEAGTFDDFWQHYGAAARALSVSRPENHPAPSTPPERAAKEKRSDTSEA